MPRRKKVETDWVSIDPSKATLKEIKSAYSARKKETEKAQEEKKKKQKTNTLSNLKPRPVKSRSASASLNEVTIENLTKIPQSYLLSILKDKFGKDSFRNKQEEIVRAAIEGHDILVILPTGAGKSLTYQLPAVIDLKEAMDAADAATSKSHAKTTKRASEEGVAADNYKRTGVTVVISPLLSLMHNQVSDLLSNNKINAVTLNGNTPQKERKEIILDLTTSHVNLQGFFSTNGSMAKNVHRAGPKTQLLYVSPELCETSSFRSVLDKLATSGNIRRFVIDEAHCCVEWGIGFRDAYIHLSYLRDRFPTVPITALTATASDEVQSQIIKILKLNKSSLKTFTTTPNRPNLHYEVCYLSEHDMDNEIMPKVIGFLNDYKRRREEVGKIITQQMELVKQQHESIGSQMPISTRRKSKGKRVAKDAENFEMYDWWSQRKPSTGSGVIYCRKRETVEEVAFRLQGSGFGARAYHAGLPNLELQKILDNWVQGTPGYEIVVATVAFGMGIDKPDVRFVIHVDLPGSIEAYFQQSGRAGRDGKGAKCMLFYSITDKNRVLALNQKEDTEAAARSYYANGNDYESDAGSKKRKLGWNFKDGFSNSKSKKRSVDPDESFDNLFENPPQGIQPGLRWLIKYCEKTNRCRHLYLCKYFDRDVPRQPTPDWCDFACDYCKDPLAVLKSSMALTKNTSDWFGY